MTEAEAKTKWCVHTNVRVNPVKCDGSSCMAWRHMRADWSAPDGVKEMVAVQGGYCGLAGKP